MPGVEGRLRQGGSPRGVSRPGPANVSRTCRRAIRAPCRDRCLRTILAPSRMSSLHGRHTSPAGRMGTSPSRGCRPHSSQVMENMDGGRALGRRSPGHVYIRAAPAFCVYTFEISGVADGALGSALAAVVAKASGRPDGVALPGGDPNRKHDLPGLPAVVVVVAPGVLGLAAHVEEELLGGSVPWVQWVRSSLYRS